MAVTFLQVDGQITGQPSGPKPIRFAYTTSQGIIRSLSLAAASNAVTFASGAEVVLLIPPSTNTVPLTLKGVTGDTGIALHATNPTWVAVSSSATALVVSATSTIADFQVIVI